MVHIIQDGRSYCNQCCHVPKFEAKPATDRVQASAPGTFLTYMYFTLFVAVIAVNITSDIYLCGLFQLVSRQILPLSLDVQKLKSCQLQGGFASDPPTSAPGPRRGLCPQTPVIGSRSRARHASEPSHFSLRSDAYGCSLRRHTV